MLASEALEVDTRNIQWRWPEFMLMAAAAAVVLWFLPHCVFVLLLLVPPTPPMSVLMTVPMGVYRLMITAQPFYALTALGLTVIALPCGAWRNDKAIRLFLAVFFACEFVLLTFSGLMNVAGSNPLGWHLGTTAFLFCFKMLLVLAISATNLVVLGRGYSWAKWIVLLHVAAIISITFLSTIRAVPNGPEYEQILRHAEATRAATGTAASNVVIQNVEVVYRRFYPDWFVWINYSASLVYLFLLRERWTPLKSVVENTAT